MREILFRGKRTDNGKWVIGMLCQYHEGIKAIIADNHFGTFEGTSEVYVVIPETVGEYTGLTDKNGKRVFEGDIIKSYQGRVFAVKFGQYKDDEEVASGNGWYVSGEWGTLSFDERWGEYEVIGNVVDNPELLKGAD